MHKIKVVFFVDVLQENFDGVANTMHRIIEHIPKEEIEPLFVTPLPPLSSDFPFKVLVVPSIDIPLYKGYPLALPQLRAKLKNSLDEFSPDVVHWSTPSLLGNFAQRYAAKRGKPTITIFHTHFASYVEYYLSFVPGLYTIKPPIERKLLSIYSKTNLVLAPTPSMADYLSSIGVKNKNLKIWGRGVNSTLFNPQNRNESFYLDRGVSAKSVKVLFVSRLANFKEIDTIIRLNKLFQGTDFQMIIVGDGPDRNRMEKEMVDAVFLGKLIGEELCVAFASADLFVFPSLTETFGNVVLEAMSSGLPVIAAKAGGPSDIIKHGVSGFLVKPRDERDIFDHCRMLIDNPELYRTVRLAAISYAQNQNWNFLCKRYFNQVNVLANVSEN
ncbi:MAG: glycosyltransferase family 4 protein [Cyclobacteriaceae bacterium]